MMETSISQNIKKLLTDRNLTQKELAEAIGVSGGTLKGILFEALSQMPVETESYLFISLRLNL